jgi:hypothetical protein
MASVRPTQPTPLVTTTKNSKNPTPDQALSDLAPHGCPRAYDPSRTSVSRPFARITRCRSDVPRAAGMANPTPVLCADPCRTALLRRFRRALVRRCRRPFYLGLHQAACAALADGRRRQRAPRSDHSSPGATCAGLAPPPFVRADIQAPCGTRRVTPAALPTALFHRSTPR